MAKSSLTVTDNRTGKNYEIPIEHGAIRAMDLRQIKVSVQDAGLKSYDPGFMNTAPCKSRITFIDGEKGILQYRGIPIEQIAQNADYLETAYLLLHGELPTRAEYDEWVSDVTHHTMLHESAKDLVQGFRHDAHPMGILVSTVGALSTFYPEAKNVRDPLVRRRQACRLIAKMPTLAAWIYRHSMGLPYAYPDNRLSYTGNFLFMMFGTPAEEHEINPVLERAVDMLFILHADHEQSCSASAMRSVGSSHADPYASAAAAIAALHGPLHGGASEQVLQMLHQIGSKDRVPQFIKDVKSSAGGVRLVGFGQRVYRDSDPRAKIIKQMADQVFEITGRNPLLEVALELERIALEDEYFLEHRLYPSLDFYSGLIYQAMKFPTEMLPVLFAIGRMSGWLAQWEEMLKDKEQRIARPRQLYIGEMNRDFVPMQERG